MCEVWIRGWSQSGAGLSRNEPDERVLCVQVSVSVVWVAEPPQSVPGWVVALAVLAGLLLLALLIFIMYKVRRHHELQPRVGLLFVHGPPSSLLCSSGSLSGCAPHRRTALRRSSCSRRRTATPTVRVPPVSNREKTVEKKMVVVGLMRCLFVLSCFVCAKREAESDAVLAAPKCLS